MTIHADFVKILKNECPDAFTRTLPAQQAPDTVFIDGQVKLMKADEIKTWAVFLNVMFFKTLERCFNHGARVVVLGFDDYTYVPTSKTMTQVKRNKQVPAMKFGEGDSLPAYMPDDWGAAMRNRTFKVKVIHKILLETRAWFLDKQRKDAAWRARTLVLDFQRRPEVLFSPAPAAPAAAPPCALKRKRGEEDAAAAAAATADAATAAAATADTADAGTADAADAAAAAYTAGAALAARLPPPESAVWRGRGECDIKAFFWMQFSRRLLIVSTDGDYIPLSMLQMLRAQGDAAPPCEVFVFRMHTRSAADAPKPGAARGSSSAALAAPAAGAPLGPKPAAPPSPPARKQGRQYEFVHVGKLMACVARLLRSEAQHPVEQFCAMVALAGCDFALSLPRLGPKTMWKLRHRLAKLDLSQPAQLLCAMSILYWDTFVMKNTMPTGMVSSASFFAELPETEARQHYAAIMHRIKNIKTLSPRIACMLWDADRAHAHALNTEWTLAYWHLLQGFPDPHSRNFGYLRDSHGRTHFAFTKQA
jgi:hypothetical protein